MTPDELTIAWSVGSGASAVIYVSDRASTSTAFGAPQTIQDSSIAADHAALSSDGLNLVVVNADGQGFSELTRTSRSAPDNAFGSPGIGDYGNFVGSLPQGQAFGDPVLDAYGNNFFYSVYSTSPVEAGPADGGARHGTVYRASRLLSTDDWPSGAPLLLDSSMTFAQEGALRRRPTGISADLQSLFFWDEVTAAEREGWIDTSDGVFDTFVTLGALDMAAPNLACTRLYYSAQGSSSLDLFYASGQ